jgi:hypothetical protein
MVHLSYQSLSVKSALHITRCIRKFAINSCGNLKVHLSKPSHTPNRYTQALHFVSNLSLVEKENKNAHAQLKSYFPRYSPHLLQYFGLYFPIHQLFLLCPFHLQIVHFIINSKIDFFRVSFEYG